jgi:hypothetical protein
MGALSAFFLRAVPGLGILPAWVWRAAAAIIGILALLAIGWIYGSNHVSEQWAEERGQRAIAEIKMRAARVEIVTKVETKYRTIEKEIFVKGDTIYQEVTKYVDKTDDAACQLRNGFVREYDASVRNEPAGPADSSDREPAGIDLSRATEVIVRNNTTLALARSKLAACIDFYRQQQTLKTRSK